MPGFLLHQGAIVTCTHQGTAAPLTTNPRVRVSGKPIVLKSSLYQITNCSLGNQPCLTAQWITAATRITSNDVPVLLADSQATTDPNKVPLTVLQTQTRVKGI